LFLDVRAFLERDLLAELLAHLGLEAVLVLHRGFPDLDRLAPALDRLVLLAGFFLELVGAARRLPVLLPEFGDLGVHLVQALERPAQSQAGGLEVVDRGGIEIRRLRGLGAFVVHGCWTRRRSRREILADACYIFMASGAY